MLWTKRRGPPSGRVRNYVVGFHELEELEKEHEQKQARLATNNFIYYFAVTNSKPQCRAAM